MAITTGIMNGTLLGVYVGGTKIAYGTTHTIDFTSATRDTTNKDTAGWSTFAAGLKAATISIEHLLAMDATYGITELFAAFDAGTELVVKFSTDNSGDSEFNGSFVITSLSVNAGNQENTTLSATMQNSTAVTFDVIV